MARSSSAHMLAAGQTGSSSATVHTARPPGRRETSGYVITILRRLPFQQRAVKSTSDGSRPRKKQKIYQKRLTYGMVVHRKQHRSFRLTSDPIKKSPKRMLPQQKRERNKTTFSVPFRGPRAAPKKYHALRKRCLIVTIPW
jgi:hypothetical protein